MAAKLLVVTRPLNLLHFVAPAKAGGERFLLSTRAKKSGVPAFAGMTGCWVGVR